MKSKNIPTLVLLFTLIFTPFAHADETTPKQAVLVTGASSGIGANITEKLVAAGYHVYAGARKDADIERLNAMDNVQAVRLDVTKQDEIDAAVEFVREQGRGLYGLVNNAGVVILGPLIEMPVEELEFQLDVNVKGVYRITQAFAPLIIESKGRITTTGSISGILSGNMFGIYAISKHAIEGYTDSLAIEMARFGVQVSVVEPGNFKSNIGATFAKRMAKKGFMQADSEYAADMEQLTQRLTTVDQQKEPDAVADAVLHFLAADKPKRRYMVTPNAGQAEFTIRQVLREMLQLNQGHDHTLSRDTLIKMLDDVSAEVDAQIDGS